MKGLWVMLRSLDFLLMMVEKALENLKEIEAFRKVFYKDISCSHRGREDKW